ncbi:hypothetical protein IV203_038556 [Nitzschia inconspicua]|uniref:Uncharacterized protein n=1 Tax=Nitzschia inconspicua TaxID=303405 RepID=A0A9K3PZC7_9STRA|nr:hypothetical protein IV203_038556 [Nitzschia inconspicua]
MKSSSSSRRMNPRRMRQMTTIALFLVLLSFTISSYHVHASTVLASTRSSDPRQRRTTSTSHHHLHHNHRHHSNCDGRPTIPAKRHACGLFLWDAPSALLYKWCQHLLKDHIYEGRGGYLFVRYESNSILQLLYPCTRYAPNKCFFCGGTFPDHLELWWSKHLYTPFDQYLDKTYNEALTLPEIKTDNNTKPRTSSQQQKQQLHRRPQVLEEAPTFAFHKRYVEDISDIANLEDDDEQRNALKQWLDKRRKDAKKNGVSAAFKVGIVPSARVTYVTALPKNSSRNSKASLLQDTVADLLSLIVKGTVDEMIQVQGIENEKRKEGSNQKSPFR